MLQNSRDIYVSREVNREPYIASTQRRSLFLARPTFARKRNEVADQLVLNGRVAERNGRIDLVAVVATDLPAPYVSGPLQIGEHAVGGALGDPRCPRQLCHCRVRMARHRQQHLGVVRDERPRSGRQRFDGTCASHIPQLRARGRPFKSCKLATTVKLSSSRDESVCHAAAANHVTWSAGGSADVQRACVPGASESSS